MTIASSGVAFDSTALFNLLGQNVLQRNLSQATETIDMSELKDGVYLARVSIEGQTQTIKILKH